MAVENEKISLNVETFRKIKTSLTNIKLLSNDKYVKKEADELLKLIESDLKFSEVSIADMIYDKMKETKRSNPDLSADLYILYRKLTDSKITESEALEAFQLSVQMEPFDKQIY